MPIRTWDELPDFMRNDAVKKYYDILQEKWLSLYVKRLLDALLAALLIVVLSPVFIVLGAAVKLGSPGPMMFCQTRVTQYGRHFLIYKFRTMVRGAERLGTQVTIDNDARITKVGRFLRRYRLDEIPQLANILKGDMSFVGTRPEVPKYLVHYQPEMMATLLLRAGVTSEASIMFRNEENLLVQANDVDQAYAMEVLPRKMALNLQSVLEFSLWRELKTMIRTVVEVGRRD